MTSQPGKQHDLHGSVPDTCPAALLLIDVINDFEFPEGDRLFDQALPIAPRIAELKKRARLAGIPAIYVNDNFSRWQSSFEQLFHHCMEKGARGRPFVEQLAPAPDDYFVLKPKHSGFYQTPLDVLLKHLGTQRLILTGLCTDSCVLFTAHDAYMRDLELYIASDCVATSSPEDQRYALDHMKSIMKAHVSTAAGIDLSALTRSCFTL